MVVHYFAILHGVGYSFIHFKEKTIKKNIHFAQIYQMKEIQYL